VASKTRTPRQKRSIGTRDRIIEAARVLFADEGFHATNTKRIAARAKVAIGSFYAYFQDKKEVFLAVLEEYNRAIAERITFLLPDPHGLADKEEILSGLIKEILDAHNLDPGLHREIALLAQTDPDVKRIMEKQESEQRALTVRYLAAWRDHISVEDLEAAAFVVFGAVESVAHALALRQTDLDSRRLTRELTAMICRYLFPAGTYKPT
jgi:AcrR family transcriptional regulator